MGHATASRILGGMNGAGLRFAILLFGVVLLVGTLGPRKLVRLMASADRTCDVAKAEGLDGDGGMEWILPASVGLPERGVPGTAIAGTPAIVPAEYAVPTRLARAPPAL